MGTGGSCVTSGRGTSRPAGREEGAPMQQSRRRFRNEREGRRWWLGTLVGGLLLLPAVLGADLGGSLDRQLAEALAAAEFTGKVEATLEARLGRRIDPPLAEVGRLLWFDTIAGLNDDNTCAGCHSPT